jgi:exopolyphosphatase/guanosine-5'-triphosphate,3'-diphosphate pyrophosphatase
MPLKESPNPIAVIDIGSNSVRLVVYDGQTRAPSVLFNEKMLCGLAKSMNSTGALSPEGAVSALATVTRFIKITRIMGIKKLHILATSAVRDANDGKAFVKKIESLHRVKVTVLSGETEAEYAGLGVISSIETINGIVGDLGGGSLELIEVNGHKIGKGYSFPIGPLRIDTAEKTARKDYLAAIDSCFAQFPFKKLHGQNFYAVGGALRNMAKIHIARKGYPLKVIHNMIIDAKELHATLEVIARMSASALQKMPGIPKKRMDFLPFAALIAMRIIEIGKPKNFIFSATGIREGLLFSKLPDAVKQQDPLISGAIEMIRRALRTPKYGIELADWVAPILVGNNKICPRLVLASCILSEISCFENTEYRAELAYRLILDSSLTGIDHRERLFIAKALYCRYSTHPDEDILAAMEPLLDEDSARKAHILGSSMRLARSISASCPGSLGKMPLKLTKNHVILTLPKDLTQLCGEVVEKRLKLLAGAIGVLGKIKLEK